MSATQTATVAAMTLARYMFSCINNKRMVDARMAEKGHDEGGGSEGAPGES